MATFEDFIKLEIRIGTIIEAEKVPETNKLMRIVLDMGTEKRQVVAGFGHIHTPEELIGKQVPVIVNLDKPAVLRGVESNGVLVALDDEKATLLMPKDTVPNGTKLK